MAERIKAVQRMFWSLVAVALVVALLGIPTGDDAATMDALTELTAFQSKFDRAALERDLLARARAQGVVPLAEVAKQVDGKGVPKLRAAAAAPPVEPSAGLALATLGQVHALGKPGSTLEIGIASASALARSLTWRLSRQPESGPQELARITLTDQRCSDADLTREVEVSDARAAALEAASAAAVAAKRHADAEQLHELRRKWKAPWKSILKADEKRREMLAASEQAQATLKQAEERYEALAKQAEAAGAGEQAPSSKCAIASAEIRDSGSGQTRTLRLPTPVEQRAVPVPPLSGVEFPVTRASGLWDAVEGCSIDQAIAQLRDRFSWHYRYVELGGLKLGGMTLLQFAPLALLPFFFALIRRSRGLSALYNPFDQPTIANLPSVGFGAGSLNLVVLVFLPLVACGLCAWSLFQIDQPPLVPLLCAVGSIGLGGHSHVALHELLELRDAITRSHSNPPPAPSST